MTDSAKAKKSLKDRAEKLLQGLSEALGSLLPEPQLRPIPVTARPRPRHRHR